MHLCFADELVTFGEEEACWRGLWSVFDKVESVEIDKNLLSSLREIRAYLTGDAVDVACTHIRFAALTAASASVSVSVSGTTPSTPASRFVALRKLVESHRYNITDFCFRIDLSLLHVRMRSIVKALLQIGSNLSQAREYRDILEDLLTKVQLEVCVVFLHHVSHHQVVEPMEDSGLSKSDVQLFLVSCIHAISAINFPARQYRAHSNVTVQSQSSSMVPSDRDHSLRGESLAAPETSGKSDLTGLPPSASSLSPHTSSLPPPAQFASPKGSLARIEILRRDWIRFITCCRLCLQQLTR